MTKTNTRTSHRDGRTWPTYLFGGRLRTSTLALIVAFVACWWLFESYAPAPQQPEQVPASEVVPPGFIPDPNYTWAPRTDVQRRTPTTTPTTTTSDTPSSTTGEPTPETTSPSTTGAPSTSPVPSTSASPTATTPAAPDSAAATSPVATTRSSAPAGSPS